MNTNALLASEEVELASQDLVASLLHQFAGPRSSNRDRAIRAVPEWLDQLMSAPQEVPAPKPAQMVRTEAPSAPKKVNPLASGCRNRSCGHCAQCLDNARWDRIFNEKFADPTYYGSLTVRHSSALAGVHA